MVKKSINTNIIYLSNIEIFESCKLDLLTGMASFYNNHKRLSKFNGLYYRSSNVFFALFATKEGPMLFYNNKQYKLSPELNICIDDKGKQHMFSINEYDIKITYQDSKYLNMDVWSTREDIDLFYQIAQSYKNEKYYKKFYL